MGEAAETATRRAEAEAKNLLSQVAVLQQQFSTSERSKGQLEKELASFIVWGDDRSFQAKPDSTWCLMKWWKGFKDRNNCGCYDEEGCKNMNNESGIG